MTKQICNIFLILILLVACGQKERVDLIIINAKIYTVDKDFSIVSALAVRNRKFLDVGNDEKICAKYHSTQIIDAGQKSIYPGFFDAHCHFLV